ncbi:MFS transporter [Candidatus Woesearchaeota archaeon]|nr:MFS transporter [Candidatus Woesearchaeota archaeon]
MHNSLESNIWKYYFIECLSGFLLIMPIIVPFYQSNGLSVTDVFLIQAAFSLAITLLEIPTGYFADAYGRKNSIIFGLALWSLGFWMYTFSYTFTGFLLSELTLGAGAAFVSGANTALIYDTLLQLKKQSSFKQVKGNLDFISSLSEAVASILGGLLAVISLRTPFLVEAIIITFALPFAFSLYEPKRDVYFHRQGHLQSLYRITHFSLRKHKKVKWLILFGSVLSTGTLIMVWLEQPYFTYVGLPLGYFGVIWALHNICVGFFSKYAGYFEQKIGKKRLLIALPFLFVVSSIGLAVAATLFTIILFFVFSFIRSMNRVLLVDYINVYVSSDSRATVLSINSFVGRLFFSAISPLIGLVHDIYTLPIAFAVTGILIFGTAITALLKLHNHHTI